MNQKQNIVLDSCVVIDIIEKPKVASRLKASLRGKSVNIILCDIVLEEVNRVRRITPETIITKITNILKRKIILSKITIEEKIYALKISEQFQICHNGDNEILSLCKTKDFILVTFDKMLLKASEFIGIQVFSPFTVRGI